IFLLHTLLSSRHQASFTFVLPVLTSQTLANMCGDAKSVGDDRQCGIHRTGRRKEATVHDVQIVEIVGFAIRVKGRILGSWPKRMVPFWWATPARGIRWPRNRFLANTPWWHS